MPTTTTTPAGKAAEPAKTAAASPEARAAPAPASPETDAAAWAAWTAPAAALAAACARYVEAERARDWAAQVAAARDAEAACAALRAAQRGAELPAPPQPRDLAGFAAWLDARARDARGAAEAEATQGDASKAKGKAKAKGKDKGTAPPPASGQGAVVYGPVKGDASQTGAFAARAVGKDETLLVVPLSACIRARPEHAARPDTWTGRAVAAGAPPVLVLLLTLMVLHERRLGDASEFAPYVRALPAAFGELPLTDWTVDEVLQLGEARAHKLLSRRVNLLAFYARAVAGLGASAATPGAPPPTPLRELVGTLADFLWAAAVVSTRQNPCAYLDDAGRTVNSVALVPGFDMINHEGEAGPQMRTFQQSGSGAYETLAWRAFREGEEVTMFYGARTYEDFLLHQGFLPGDDRGDVAFEVSLGSDAFSKARAAALRNTPGLDLLAPDETKARLTLLGPAGDFPLLLCARAAAARGKEDLADLLRLRMKGEGWTPSAAELDWCAEQLDAASKQEVGGAGGAEAAGGVRALTTRLARALAEANARVLAARAERIRAGARGARKALEASP